MEFLALIIYHLEFRIRSIPRFRYIPYSILFPFVLGNVDIFRLGDARWKSRQNTSALWGDRTNGHYQLSFIQYFAGTPSGALVPSPARSCPRPPPATARAPSATSPSPSPSSSWSRTRHPRGRRLLLLR